jgi:hypothetical protein
MQSKQDRAELEMQIIRFRKLARRMTDREFLGHLSEHIAELETELHEDKPNALKARGLRR